MFGKKQHYDRIINLLVNLTEQQATETDHMSPISADTPAFIRGAMMQHEMTRSFTIIALTKAVLVLKEGGTEEQATHTYFNALGNSMEKQWEKIKEGIRDGRYSI